ncbi:cytosine permease [Enterococcus pallens]|uniref:Cytosine/purines uracil thiamine allantoin permease n=1 Tax=Enterococcus pallens ATCC BAA-351 TaxID=1158607 RepID=R2PVN3_9ENTE|nr:cytosine permease [Enterococcus pallens]EOH87283.1 cytosine/purines uracil thiamine allantoin permease [Enterococcus pallens ATCC BAA-351]EOU18225.1 cytosine/purines uracil thiamine allantoin permease [Enterococcus pallens ATCC BAA-351]OJG77087.1 cytosine/purines uracil thiamine allantoin permease [Enterococcus pallens]
MNEEKNNQSWQSLAFVWAGAMICVPSLMIGGTLVSGMSFLQALLVGLVGYGIIVVLMILQGMQGADLHKPTVSMASQVFGKVGSQKIISIILMIACLGWFGIQANVCGQAFTTFLATYGIQLPIQISSLIWGVIMLVSALYGIKFLNILNYVAVPVLVVTCIYGVIVSISNSSVGEILSYQGTGDVSMASGLAITIGSFALGAVIAGDYSQYCASRGDVIKAATLGILPSGVLMIGVGAILTLTAGTADIAEVFMGLGSPVLGVIALILATWTTNAVNAFSGGLAMINVFNISKEKEKMAVAVAGGIGTVLAVVGILNYFVPIMSVLSAMVPAVAGVMIASYWVVQKGDPEKWQPVDGVNWLGILSWLIGAVVASTPVILSFFPSLPQLPNQPLIGIVLSFICYLIGNKVFVKQSAQIREVEE